MFEEGVRLKRERGADAVFDFSLGNPDVEPPQAVLEALRLAGTFLTQDDVWNRAGSLAEQWHLDDGGRLLVTEDVDDLDAWIACLAVPLVSRGSVVLAVGEQDINRLVDAERVTAIAAPRP